MAGVITLGRTEGANHEEVCRGLLNPWEGPFNGGWFRGRKPAPGVADWLPPARGREEGLGPRR